MPVSTFLSRWSIALSVGTLALVGCGGGGGGGGGTEFVGAAEVSLNVQPTRIDSGDRTEVSVLLGSVHQNGVALKFSFPDGLRYVPQSGVLLVRDRGIDISPTINVESQDDGNIYVVFYLAQSLFKEPGQDYEGETGTVTLQLEGITSVREGKIEIDADVDDPQEDNATEFHLDNPEFAAEDDSSIEVID